MATLLFRARLSDEREAEEICPCLSKENQRRWENWHLRKTNGQVPSAQQPGGEGFE